MLVNSLVRNVAVLSVLITAALSGCGGGGGSHVSTEKEQSIAVQVVNAQAVANDWRDRVPGTVRSVAEVTIEAKISGRIVSVQVEEGRPVRVGQHLLEISAAEMQSRLDQAIASEKQAQQDMVRFKKLLPQGAITRQEFDVVETRLQLAAAGVAEARTMLGYAKIEAPFDGIVTKKLCNEGDFAQPGKPLLMIERQDLFRFEVHIPESSLVGLSQGGALQVQLSGFSEALQGVVSEISPTTDPNSRTRHVKLDLPSDPRVRTGQFGYALIPRQGRPSIRLPESALYEKGQIEGVFVVRDNRAHLRLVRTGKREAGQVEILSGLSGGEVVAVSEVMALRDGRSVSGAP